MQPETNHDIIEAININLHDEGIENGLKIFDAVFIVSEEENENVDDDFDIDQETEDINSNPLVYLVSCSICLNINPYDEIVSSLNC